MEDDSSDHKVFQLFINHSSLALFMLNETGGEGKSYKWGSNFWTETTWGKVHVIAAVFDLGFHVIHSDLDVTWFKVNEEEPCLFCSMHAPC